MEMICIGCPMGCKLLVEVNGEAIYVEGNACKRGIEFAKNEVNNPTRGLTTTVRTMFKEMPVLPVRIDGEIPKDKLFAAMKILSEILIKNEVKCGDVILENILQSGNNVIATSSIKG